MSEQPDDIVTALAEALRDLSWGGRQLTGPHAKALAEHVQRSSLVLPAADVIPKQAVRDLAMGLRKSGIGPEGAGMAHAADRLDALLAGGAL